mgnify:CR=1 FL=1
MSPPASQGTVKREQRGPVTVLTLSYPERRNALSLPLREALDAERVKLTKRFNSLPQSVMLLRIELKF